MVGFLRKSSENQADDPQEGIELARVRALDSGAGWRLSADCHQAARIIEHVQGKDAPRHRRHRLLRERRDAPLPRLRHRRDPGVQPRREEAGRLPQALRQRQTQVLHRRRSRLLERHERHARRRLRLQRRRAEAGSVLRVLSPRGGQDQRARHRERDRGFPSRRSRPTCSAPRT